MCMHWQTVAGWLGRGTRRCGAPHHRLPPPHPARMAPRERGGAKGGRPLTLSNPSISVAVGSGRVGRVKMVRRRASWSCEEESWLGGGRGPARRCMRRPFLDEQHSFFRQQRPVLTVYNRTTTSVPCDLPAHHPPPPRHDHGIASLHADAAPADRRLVGDGAAVVSDGRRSVQCWAGGADHAELAAQSQCGAVGRHPGHCVGAGVDPGAAADCRDRLYGRGSLPERRCGCRRPGTRQGARGDDAVPAHAPEAHCRTAPVGRQPRPRQQRRPVPRPVSAQQAARGGVQRPCCGHHCRHSGAL